MVCGRRAFLTDEMFKAPDGSRFIGEWDHGVAHGQVEILSQDGKTIRGQMIRGVLEGYAHWQDSNGVYAGHFKGGERDGVGSFKCSEYTYEGQWRGGRMHGRGELTSATSRTHYIGAFKNGGKHGKGEVKYSKHHALEHLSATWEHGERNGKAKVSFSPVSNEGIPDPVEISMSCTFKDDMLHGTVHPRIVNGRSVICNDARFKDGAFDPPRELRPDKAYTAGDVVRSMFNVADRSFGCPLDLTELIVE